LPVDAAKEKRKRKREKKAAIDPNAPKNPPRSGYLLFTSSYMGENKPAAGSGKAGQMSVMRGAASAWADMTAEAKGEFEAKKLAAQKEWAVAYEAYLVENPDAEAPAGLVRYRKGPSKEKKAKTTGGASASAAAAAAVPEPEASADASDKESPSKEKKAKKAKKAKSAKKSKKSD